MTDDEIADKTRLEAFADKLPQVRRTGEDFADDEARMRRESFAKAVNMMWRHPEITLQAASWCENRVRSLQTQGSETMFKKPPPDLRSIDCNWSASWVTERSAVNAAALEQLLATDPDTVQQILEFGLVCSLSLKLPKTLVNKDLLSRALVARSTSVGGRLASFGAKALRDPSTGTVNWKLHGVYHLAFDTQTGRCNSITHRPTLTKVEPPAHVIITTGFMLTENWSDFSAKATLEPSVFLLCKFFERGTGPHAHKLWSGDNQEWRALVAGEEAKYQVETSTMRSNTVVVEPIGKKVKDAKRKASMVKAREALQKHKNDIKNKRIISFT